MYACFFRSMSCCLRATYLLYSRFVWISTWFESIFSAIELINSFVWLKLSHETSVNRMESLDSFCSLQINIFFFCVIYIACQREYQNVRKTLTWIVVDWGAENRRPFKWNRRVWNGKFICFNFCFYLELLIASVTSLPSNSSFIAWNSSVIS